jgi:hypothetical protein
MSHREAPPRIVPPVVVDDGAGYRRPAKCPLCNCGLEQGAIIYWSLPSDPDGLRRCVHAFCAHEYAKFMRAVGYSV